MPVPSTRLRLDDTDVIASFTRTRDFTSTRHFRLSYPTPPPPRHTTLLELLCEVENYNGHHNVKLPDRLVSLNAAVARLDSHMPNWRDHVNVDDLDMQSCQNCVLGQVFDGYLDGLTVLYGSDIEAYENGDPAPFIAVYHELRTFNGTTPASWWGEEIMFPTHHSQTGPPTDTTRRGRALRDSLTSLRLLRERRSRRGTRVTSSF